jgi:hypothetical protein
MSENNVGERFVIELTVAPRRSMLLQRSHGGCARQERKDT